jgi:hypothetical protein
MAEGRIADARESLKGAHVYLEEQLRINARNPMAADLKGAEDRILRARLDLDRLMSMQGVYTRIPESPRALARHRFEKSLVDLLDARRLHARNPREANLWRYEQQVERQRRELESTLPPDRRPPSPLTPRRALAAHNERVSALGVEVLPEFDNQVVEARNRALDTAQNNQGRLSRKRRKRRKKRNGTRRS